MGPPESAQHASIPPTFLPAHICVGLIFRFFCICSNDAWHSWLFHTLTFAFWSVSARLPAKKIQMAFSFNENIKSNFNISFTNIKFLFNITPSSYCNRCTFITCISIHFTARNAHGLNWWTKFNGLTHFKQCFESDRQKHKKYTQKLEIELEWKICQQKPKTNRYHCLAAYNHILDVRQYFECSFHTGDH